MPINKNTDANWEKARENLVDAAEKAGVDPGIMAKIAGFESNYSSTNRPIHSDPKKNTVTQFDGVKAMSSAYGYGQFINGTWAEIVREHGTKYGVQNAESLTDKQVNAPELRSDPKLQAAMLAELTKHNVDLGRKLGGADDDANVYALHNLGEPDGPKFLRALKENPNQSVSAVFPASRGDSDKDGISNIIEGNPGLYLKDGKPVTVAEAYTRMGKYMDQYEKYAKEVSKDQPQRTETPAKTGPGEQVPADKAQTKTEGEGTWPAPGNYSINKADKRGEGQGGWNTPRPAHRDGDGHDGVDIQGKVGDPIKAFKGGTVVTAGFVRGYGNTIDIRHDDGSVTRYAHLDKIDGKVKPGHPVSEGQQIGKMGQTGNSPKTGDAHLHFEVRVKGKDVDPMPFLNKANRDGKQIDAGKTDPTRPDKASVAMKDGVLEVGDRGPEVKEYLEKLDKLGYKGPKGESLLADKPEIYGPAAKHATEQFQKAHGLEIDGKAGKNTLPAVDKAQTRPLLSEANHAHNKLFVELGKQMPGVKPEVVANATVKAVEGNITDPSKLAEVRPDPKDPEVKWMIGNTPGDLAKVNVTEPTAKMQDISDFLGKEAQQAQQGTPALTQNAVVEEERKQPAKSQ